jgi:hypothetical protein
MSGVFDLLGKVLPKVVELKVPVSEQLVHAYMEDYFCTFLSLNRTADHLIDLPTLEFLTAHKPAIESYYVAAKIK